MDGFPNGRLAWVLGQIRLVCIQVKPGIEESRKKKLQRAKEQRMKINLNRIESQRQINH